MPADMTALAADLAAESAVTRALVAGLDEPGWHTPTPAVGWDIADQISHLAYFDEVTIRSAVDPERFSADLAAATDTADPDAVAARFRGRTGAQLLGWFDAARAGLITTFAGLDPRARLPWFGPAMSAASSLTARIMETWAHTQDIADALGVTREPTGRLRHVAHIGVGARAFGYAVRGMTPPRTPVRVELAGPDGTVWAWGPENAEDRVTGPALDFCLLVTQRRHRDDLTLVIEGPAAAGWMGIAQAFAAPPGGASAFGGYWPALIPACLVSQTVHLGDGRTRIVRHHASPGRAPASLQAGSAPAPWPSGPAEDVPLGRVCGARSGDKGGDANVGLGAVSPRGYAWLRGYLTTARFRELPAEAAGLRIDRYELPNLLALNFVVHGLLGPGVSATTRPDAQAKGLGEYLRSRVVPVPADLLRPGEDGAV